MTQAAQRQQDALLASAVPHQTPGLAWQQWSDAGAGERLLLLHGGFGSWNHWFANIDELRRQRELWTLDLPGLGASADIAASATPDDFAACILDGVRTLWPDQAPLQLAGFSFGAMVGARLAQRLGQQCVQFTAIGAAGWGELHVQVPLNRPPGPGTAWDVAAPIHEANLRALMFSDRFSIDELAIYLHADNLARARFNSRGLSRTDDFVRTLPGISAPTVCVWGSADATAGGDEALGARAALLEDLGVHFALLARVGHWAMYEDPTAINAVLLGQAAE